MRELNSFSRAALQSPVPKILLLIIALGLMFVTLVPVRWPSNARAAEGGAEVVTVNAASYTGPLAPGAIAAAFGVNLATATSLAAQVPLPTELSGSSVRLIDSANIERSLSLFFVSSGQINFLIPDETALGLAQLVISRGDGTSSRGTIEIAQTSPAIFTVFSNGSGAPVAMTTFDGANYQTVTNADGTLRTVNRGTAWQPNYLVAFGTGLRHAANLRVRIGGVEVTPFYAGPQGTFAGLDQINFLLPQNAPGGMVDFTLNTADRVSNVAQLRLEGEASLDAAGLTQTEVQTVIAQAVGKALQVGLKVTVAVLDHEGNVVGVFKMDGARSDTKLGSIDLLTGRSLKPADADGLTEITIPLRNPDGSFVAPPGILREGAALAAISKAGTAAFFSTQGNAFTTRTAGFIIQEHVPPLVDFTPGGPLFGVQFSQLPCSDIKIPNLPLGLAGDPGGVPIYKNGVAVGGVGVEGDGFYSVDLDPGDDDQSLEEIIAVAATQGFEAPAAIRGDQIVVDGVRLPFVNAAQTGVQAPAFSSLAGTILSPILGVQTSRFTPLTLGGIPGRFDSRFFPFRDGALVSATRLTAGDVNTIITQAAQQAYRTRAAIRRPLGSPAEVNITVVDTTGAVLGLFSTIDAPIFGFDVSVQKARTAAFFSQSSAAARLRNVGVNIARFVDAAASDGIRLDGAVAFSDRAIGFLSRPFFPDDIDGTQNGPFSKPIAAFSPFNNGLQIALVKPALASILSGVPQSCVPAIPGLANGIQIFAGSVPIYKNGVLVGAVGISGDGIDQDDIIASTGSVGFETPAIIRADQTFVRAVRLPWVKFPRHPNL